MTTTRTASARLASTAGSLLGAALIFTACGDPPPLYGDQPVMGNNDEVLSCGADTTVGVPVDDRPSYQERLALYFCDRSRADPAVINWPSYPAVPPLSWVDGLAQAARAHSQDMRDTPCFQHESCDGTDPFVRIKKFFDAGTEGENIMAGINDGETAIHNWIEEIGAAPGTTGHRDNMFSAMFDLVGFGYITGGTKFQGYWTQDFAGTGMPTPHLPAGTHYPNTASAGQKVKFATVFYDKSGKAPDRIDVLVDGKPTSLSLVAGKEGMGAYEAEVPMTAGCHRYRFRAVVGGTPSCYPGTGTLGVAPFNTDCAEWK